MTEKLLIGILNNTKKIPNIIVWLVSNQVKHKPAVKLADALTSKNFTFVSQEALKLSLEYTHALASIIPLEHCQLF